MKDEHFVLGIALLAIVAILACFIGYATDTLPMRTREAPSQQTPVKTSSAGIPTAVWNVLMPNISGSGDPALQKLPYTPSVDGDRLIAIGTGAGNQLLWKT